MALFKMSQSDVVIGLVHLRCHGKLFNHPPHHLKALTVMTAFEEAYAHLQSRLGALFVVRVFLTGHGLVMHASLVVGVALSEMMFAQHKVRLKSDLTARVPLHNRLPNLQSLFLFPSVVAQFADLQKFAGGAVFDNGPANRRGGLYGQGEEENSREKNA